MLVKYSSDKGWTSNLLPKKSTISKDILNFFNKTQNYDFTKIGSTSSQTSYEYFAKLFDKLRITNEQFKEWVLTVEPDKITLDNYQAYLKNTNTTLTKLGSTLKNVAANMGIMLAVSLAVKTGIAIWDKLNVTLEEQKEIVDNLKSEITTLREEEQKLLELQAQGGITEAEESRLKYLQRRLELDERIYKQEQKKLADNELYGKGDILSDGLLGNEGEVGKSKQKYLNNLSNIEREQKKLDNYLKYANEYSEKDMTGTAESYLNKAQKTESKIDELKGKLNEAQGEYLNYANAIKNYLDIGVWDDSPVKKSEMEGLYQEYLKMADQIENDIVKVNLEIDTVHADTYKNNIERTLENKGALGAVDQNYLDSLSAEELRTVNLGIEQGTITSWTELTTAVDDYRKSIEEANKVEPNAPQFKDTISSVSERVSELDSLSSILEDVKNKGTFDFDALGDGKFVETFGKYEAEYKNFIDTITNSPNDIKACQDAFDSMATAWLNGSGILDGLNEENKNYIAKLLEANGIANANEIVNYRLAQSKAIATAATLDMSASEEINLAIMQESLSVYGLTATEVNNLSITYLEAQKLMSVAVAEGVSGRLDILATELEGVQSIADAYNLINSKSGAIAKDGSVDDRGLASSYSTDQGKAIIGIGAIRGKLNTLKTQVKGYSGGGATSGGGGGGSKVEPYKAEIDALKKYTEAYEEAKAKRDAIDKKYDNAKTNEEKLELANERIKAMEEEQKAIEALNEARDKEIAKNVEKLRSQKFDVIYDPYSDKLQINNLEHLNELKGKDQEKTNELIKEYEDIIKSTEDMAKANKDLAVTWQDNVYTLDKYREEIQKLKEEIYDDKLEDFDFKLDVADSLDNASQQIEIIGLKVKTTIQELNEAYASGLDNTSDYVQKLIKNLMDFAEKLRDIKKEELEDKKDDYDSAKNAVVNRIDENIEALNEQKKALQDINDEQDRALQLSKLKENLSKAKENKVIHVYRKGKG